MLCSRGASVPILQRYCRMYLARIHATEYMGPNCDAQRNGASTALQQWVVSTMLCPFTCSLAFRRGALTLSSDARPGIQNHSDQPWALRRRLECRPPETGTWESRTISSTFLVHGLLANPTLWKSIVPCLSDPRCLLRASHPNGGNPSCQLSR